MNPQTHTLRFDQDYREEVTLKGGQALLLRTVRPSDKDHLVKGLARLSTEARYLRFLSAKKSLSSRELRYLTELDGFDHFALGALIEGDENSDEGIGVARIIRLKENAQVAEPAITVLDDYQGLGLGALLMRRLVQAARERGINRFRCGFLARNDRIKNLLDDYDHWQVIDESDGIVTMEFPLPKPELSGCVREAVQRSAMYNVFTRVAGGEIKHSPRTVDLINKNNN